MANKYYITAVAINDGSSELAHHGIKGMRWGIRRTAAQLGHTARTKRKRAKALKKARATRKKQNEEIDRAIAKSDTKTLRKYAQEGKLTDKQIERFQKQFDMNQKISELDLQKARNSSAKIQEMANKMGNVSNMMDKGINMYNDIAKIHNAMNPDNPMQVVGQNFIDANQIAATKLQNANNLRIQQATKKKLDAADKAEKDANRKRIQDRVNGFLGRGKDGKNGEAEGSNKDSSDSGENSKGKTNKTETSSQNKPREKDQQERDEDDARKWEQEKQERSASAKRMDDNIRSTGGSYSNIYKQARESLRKNDDLWSADADRARTIMALSQMADSGSDYAKSELEKLLRNGK